MAIALGLGAGSPASVWSAETASFLKISPGARPLGMGEAFTAVADDLNSLVWNPAGLASMRSREAAFMHAELYSETRYDFIGYAHPLGGKEGTSTLGFGAARLSHGAIEGRDENRRATGGFTASDTVLHVGYSRPVMGGTKLGVGFKYLQSAIADETAVSGAFDVGLMHDIKAGARPVTLGASLLNIGPGMRFVDQTDELPLTVSVGAGVRMMSSVLLAMDVRHRPHTSRTSVGFGMEYTMLSSLNLRAGYTARPAAPSTDGGVGAALQGMGMGFGLRIGKARLDYSFAPAGELGNTQRVSLSTRF